MDINQAWGKALRKERTERGLSQDELAHRANLNRTYISLLELGKRSPSLNTMAALAETLKIPPSELLRKSESPILQSDQEYMNSQVRFSASDFELTENDVWLDQNNNLP